MEPKEVKVLVEERMRDDKYTEKVLGEEDIAG